jgi:hypothetical protein
MCYGTMKTTREPFFVHQVTTYDEKIASTVEDGSYDTFWKALWKAQVGQKVILLSRVKSQMPVI